MHAYLSWLFLIITLWGMYLNAKQQPVSFLLWIASNSYFAWYHLQNRDPAMVIFFTAGIIFCIYGYLNWHHKMSKGAQ